MAMPFARGARFAALLALAGCAGSPRETPPGDLRPPRSAGATSPEITESDLQLRLGIVAADSMGGRATGSPGHIMVTNYLARELQRLGLQPAGDNGTYLQQVPFYHRDVVSAELSINGTTLRHPADFITSSGQYVLPQIANAPIWVASPFDTTTWPSLEQARGAFVVLRTPNPNFLPTFSLNNERFRNAVGFAIAGAGAMYPRWVQFYERAVPSYRNPKIEMESRPHLIVLSDAAAERILGGPLASAAMGAQNRTISGRIELRDRLAAAYNVVAVLPGRDPALRGQYVVLGSHIDGYPLNVRPLDHDSVHMVNAAARRAQIDENRELTAADAPILRARLDSIRAVRAPRPDSIRNGADDDGSGTVAMLEIAENLVNGSQRPRRSTLFVWHVGEELGLIGARYYSDFPTVPRDSIAAQFEMDMIGRGLPGEEPGGGPDYMQLLGLRRRSTELGGIVERINQRPGLRFRFDLNYDAPGHEERFYCRSDHYMYARYGIPVVFFSTGGHGDYHAITDEAQYIDYPKLRRSTLLIRDVMLEVSNMDRRLILDVEHPGPEGECVQ